MFNNFRNDFKNKVLEHPARMIFLSFFLLILNGAVFLNLPFSSHKELNFIDTLFISTSAVCVTGLSTIDISKDLTTFGQLLLLLLIQIGGLGITTFSTFYLFKIKKTIDLKSRVVMQNIFEENSFPDFIKILTTIIISTFILEAVGTLVLALGFLKYNFPPQKALWLGFFHSVSAFCNAGFSLFPDGLIRFKSSATINFTIILLIISGGIGFLILSDLFYFSISKKKLSFHTKTVLLINSLLIVSGFLIFLSLEYNNVLKDFPLKTKLLAAFFQNITTRTAGFNTIDISTISNATVLFVIIYMFIGASPGSTGGGIKTTTFFVLILNILATLKGKNTINIFKRTVSDEVIKKSILIFFSSCILIFLFTFSLLLTDDFNIRETLFEVVSAFGTVGLSLGITPTLSDLSKILLSIVMFIGRIGIPTFVLAFSFKEYNVKYKYPMDKILIG